MKKSLPDLNLIDLISNKHLALRKYVTDRDSHGLNKTESHVLSLLEAEDSLSISDISRKIHISRQGAHKCVQGLLARGMIAPAKFSANSRDRFLTITPAGMQCNQQLLAIKLELQERLRERLGEETFRLIKSTFQEEWLE